MVKEVQCRDCGARMHPIRLIDKAHLGVHDDFVYAVEDAARHWFTGTYPVAGTVKATMCAACGRIELRGEAQSS